MYLSNKKCHVLYNLTKFKTNTTIGNLIEQGILG